jgi:hypothetical protein
MVTRAWFFGDSFTKGYGAEKDSRYFKEYGPGKLFSELLSDSFEAQEMNFGLPGKCNNAIVKSITEQLLYIKPDDIVIITNTSPLRDLVPHNSEPRLISQKLLNSGLYPESLGYSDNEVSEALIQYCLKVRANYIPEWNRHYRELFLNFTNYFLLIGCRAIFWDYSIWSEEEEPGMKFENIHTATEGKIYDLHWSYKGHRDAYEWIKDGLEKGKKFLK